MQDRANATMKGE